ncbi:hypothetical protein BXA08_04175 [Campylobacter lari]|nr:hypothetical protein [Campylobacter lari]
MNEIDTKIGDKKFKDSTSPYDTHETVEIYKKRWDIYESFKDVLEKYLKKLIDQAIEEGKIKIDKNSINIQTRTKKVESFRGKIERDDKKTRYQDPLNDITDLVGAKIMLTSLKDENIMYDFLRQELKNCIDEKNSIDKTQDIKKERKFGYLGRHLVISYDDKMLTLIEDKDKYNGKDFTNFKAEIQIKTLLQHVWAEVEHKARYKAGEELDNEKKRYFDRLAALIEVADDLFKDLLDETEKINKKAKKRIEKEQNNLTKEKNSASYKNETFLKETKVPISSKNIAFYLVNDKVKEKFKQLNQENMLYVLHAEEPNSISVKFIELLRIVDIHYTQDLNVLFDEKNKQILFEYAKAILEKDKAISRLPKLSVLQILIYAKASQEQKKQIKEKRLIFDRTCRILDQLNNKGINNA